MNKLIVVVLKLSLLINLTFASEINIKKGWQLLGATERLSLESFNRECINFIWKYENSNEYKWQFYIPNLDKIYFENFSIEKGDGFWVNANQDCLITNNIESLLPTFATENNLNNYKENTSDKYYIYPFPKVTDIFFYENKSYLIDSNFGIQEFELINNEIKIINTYYLDVSIDNIVGTDNNLLYTSYKNEFQIFDIKDGFSFVKEFKFDNYSSYETILSNDRDKFFCTDRYGGLKIFDLNSFTLTSNYNTFKSWRSDYFVQDVLVSKDKNIIYLAIGAKGIEIVDISNIETPSRVKFIDNFFSQGLTLNETKDTLFSIAIYWDDENSYELAKAKLFKLDVSNPKEPIFISSIDLYGNFAESGILGAIFPQNISTYNNKIFVANENSIQIYDYDLNFIKYIKVNGEIYNFKFNDNKLFIANSNKLKIVDLNNLSKDIEENPFNTVNKEYITYTSPNIVDVFFDNNKSYIIDSNQGIKEFILIDNKPKIVNSYYTFRKINRFIGIYDNLLYTLNNETRNKIEVFDMKNNFYLVNEFEIESYNIYDTILLNEKKEFLSVNGYSGVIVFDLNGTNIFQRDAEPYYAKDLVLFKNILYIAGNDALMIIDISNLNEIMIINLFNLLYDINFDGLALDKEEKLLFAVGLYWRDDEFMDGKLFKFDISNLVKPTFISSTDLYGNFWESAIVGSNFNFPQNMSIYNKKIFIANKNSIQIYDYNLNFIKKIEVDGEIFNFRLNNNKLFIAYGNDLKVVNLENLK